MIFSILVILLVGVIAYFHFVQGLFSATLSAIIAVLSAVFAVSYHENVVNMFPHGKMADVSHGMVLCILFLVTYSVLRIIFDSAVPGNVRTPTTIDKVGGAVMGVIAGIFATGIFAIAVQMLPWDAGISIMGYSRQAIGGTRSVVLPVSNGHQAVDTHVDNEMKDATLDPEKETKLWLPVDDIVLNTVYHLSDGGSLAGDRPLASIHPDYLQELFGERLGIQVGARHAALQTDTDPIEVSRIFAAPMLPCADGLVKDIRPGDYQPAYKSEVKPGPGQDILVLRVHVNNPSDDEDTLFRFSTGSIHLVGKNPSGIFKDYFPIGTLENGNTVLLNKPDDFLFIKAGDSFDAVFVVDDSLLQGGKTTNLIAPDVFISVKRFGLQDLSGKPVSTPITADSGVKVIRNPLLMERLKVPPARETGTAQPSMPTPGNTPPAVSPTPGAPSTPQATADKPIAEEVDAVVDSKILAPGSIVIGTKAADPEAQGAAVAGGKLNLTGGLIATATVDPTASLSALGEGAGSYSQFYTPEERAMVQVQVRPYTPNWDWLGQEVDLIDTNGNKISASGFYSLVKTSDSRGLFLRYSYNRTLAVTAPTGDPDGTLYFIFLLPRNIEIKSFSLGGKSQNLSAPVKIQ